MTIESKNFVATTGDIEKLTDSILTAAQTIDSGRGTYLKALVATTQSDLGAEPRKRSGRAERLDEAGIAKQLAAFEAVYGRFHEVVVRVAQATVPDPDAALMRSRTAFSRSAGSTVRGYLRAGNDITALAAHRVTKASLAVPKTKRKFSVDMLKRRVKTLADALEAVAKNLQAANREIAHETLAPVLARLATAAGEVAHTTKDPQKAAEEGRPWETKTGVVFMPLDFSAARAKRVAA